MKYIFTKTVDATLNASMNKSIAFFTQCQCKPGRNAFDVNVNEIYTMFAFDMVKN